MSNLWYDKVLTKIGRGQLDLNSLTDPRIIAIEDGLYSFSQTHEFLSDVIAGARVATTALVSDVFGTPEGWFDANDVVFTTPTAGKIVNALIIYDNLASEAISPLLLFIDDANILPIITESSKDLEIEWQGTAIIRL